jgi:hypothetical protein
MGKTVRLDSFGRISELGKSLALKTPMGLLQPQNVAVHRPPRLGPVPTS